MKKQKLNLEQNQEICTIVQQMIDANYKKWLQSLRGVIPVNFSLYDDLDYQNISNLFPIVVPNIFSVNDWKSFIDSIRMDFNVLTPKSKRKCGNWFESFNQNEDRQFNLVCHQREESLKSFLSSQEFFDYCQERISSDIAWILSAEDLKKAYEELFC